MPVLLGAVDDADAQPTFGAAMRAKLADVAAARERWSSWKDPSGWIVKLQFQVGVGDVFLRDGQRGGTLLPVFTE